jgi:hypothetical protein
MTYCPMTTPRISGCSTRPRTACLPSTSGRRLTYGTNAITGIFFARRVAAAAFAAFNGSGTPPHCMACGVRFKRKRLPAVFVSARPMREDASVGMISFMCERCTPDDWAAVQQKVTEAFRAGPIPDAEVVNIGPAGNA